MANYTNRSVSITGTLVDTNGDVVSGIFKLSANVNFVDVDNNLHLIGDKPEYYTVTDGVVNVQLEGSDYTNPTGITWTLKFVRAGTTKEYTIFSMPINFDDGFSRDISELMLLDAITEDVTPSALVDLQNQVAQNTADIVDIQSTGVNSHEVNTYKNGKWQIDSPNLVTVNPAGGAQFTTIEAAVNAGNNKIQLSSGVHTVSSEVNFKLVDSNPVQLIGPEGAPAEVHFGLNRIQFGRVYESPSYSNVNLSNCTGVNDIITTIDDISAMVEFPIDLATTRIFCKHDMSSPNYVYEVVEIIDAFNFRVDRTLDLPFNDEPITLYKEVFPANIGLPNPGTKTITGDYQGSRYTTYLPSTLIGSYLTMSSFGEWYKITNYNPATGEITLDTEIHWSVEPRQANIWVAVMEKPIFYNIDFYFENYEPFGESLMAVDPLFYKVRILPEPNIVGTTDMYAIASNCEGKNWYWKEIEISPECCYGANGPMTSTWEDSKLVLSAVRTGTFIDCDFTFDHGRWLTNLYWSEGVSYRHIANLINCAAKVPGLEAFAGMANKEGPLKVHDQIIGHGFRKTQRHDIKFNASRLSVTLYECIGNEFYFMWDPYYGDMDTQSYIEVWFYQEAFQLSSPILMTVEGTLFNSAGVLVNGYLWPYGLYRAVASQWWNSLEYRNTILTGAPCYEIAFDDPADAEALSTWSPMDIRITNTTDTNHYIRIQSGDLWSELNLPDLHIVNLGSHTVELRNPADVKIGDIAPQVLSIFKLVPGGGAVVGQGALLIGTIPI